MLVKRFFNSTTVSILFYTLTEIHDMYRSVISLENSTRMGGQHIGTVHAL